MFINIINFPPVAAGKETEFGVWFAWSNGEYAKHKVFISRKLLKPRGCGDYIGIVEPEGYETFMAMHTSPTQAEAGKRIRLLLDGSPSPAFLEIVVE